MFFKWQGNGAGTKSAWNDGRNWVNEFDAPYEQARYPGSKGDIFDDVVIDAPVVAPALSIAGYDGSALEVLRSFRVGPLYDGTIGSAETNLKLNFAYIHLNALANTGIYLNSATFYTDGKPPREANILSGQNIKLAGWIPPLNLAGATSVEIKDNATLTEGSTTYVGDGVNLTIGENVSYLTFRQTGGNVVCSSGGSVEQSAGTWAQVKGNLTHKGSGGTLNWIGGDVILNSAGVNIITANGNDARCVRAGSAIYAGSTLDLNNPNANIRIKDAISMNGGDIKFPVGSKLWLKGEYVLINGIMFHVGKTGTNETTSTEYFQIGPNDHLTSTILYSAETGDSVGFVFTIASDSSGTGAESYSGTLTLLEGEGSEPSTNQNISRAGVWGMDLPTDKRWIKVTMIHTSVEDSIGTLLLELRRF